MTNTQKLQASMGKVNPEEPKKMENPPFELPENLLMTLDLSEYPWIWEQIHTDAKKFFRTPELQAVSILASCINDAGEPVMKVQKSKEKRKYSPKKNDKGESNDKGQAQNP